MARCKVELTREERDGLLARADRGGGAANGIKRANILLAVDRGEFGGLRMTDERAARAHHPTPRTACDTKRRPVGGLRGDARQEEARRAPQAQGRRRGRGQDRGPGPRGPSRGARQAGAPAHGGEVGRARPRRVRRPRRRGRPPKDELRPWVAGEWRAPEHSGGSVAATGDVLRACERPADPARPLVCPDESSRQPVAHSREPLPARPGDDATRDHGYVRNGVADVFTCLAPHPCERRVRVTRTRTRTDLAETPRWLSGDACPRAERMAVVWDNLNTHPAGSPCEAFPPDEAERLAARLELRHTPRHGSRLDMAEVGVGCPMRHGLPSRVGAYEELERLVAAWERDRNGRARIVEWTLRVEGGGGARERLARLYPVIEMEESVK